MMMKLWILICLLINKETQDVVSTDIYVELGATATLPCRTKLDAPVDWWYQRDTTVLEEPVCTADCDTHTTHCEHCNRWPRVNIIDASTPGDYTLTIYNVTVSDVGLYTCVENCGAGTRHTNRLNISVPGTECASKPCQNNGTCTEGENGYTCECTAGYNGINCADAVPVVTKDKPAEFTATVDVITVIVTVFVTLSCVVFSVAVAVVVLRRRRRRSAIVEATLNLLVPLTQDSTESFAATNQQWVRHRDVQKKTQKEVINMLSKIIPVFNGSTDIQQLIEELRGQKLSQRRRDELVNNVQAVISTRLQLGQENQSALRDIVMTLLQCSLEVAKVHEGSVIIRFVCVTVESVHHLWRLVTFGHLRRLMMETIKQQVTREQLLLVTVHIDMKVYWAASARLTGRTDVNVKQADVIKKVPIESVPLEVLELMIVKAAVSMTRATPAAAGDFRKSLNTLSAVSSRWSTTVANFNQSPTGQWIHHLLHVSVKQADVIKKVPIESVPLEEKEVVVVKPAVCVTRTMQPAAGDSSKSLNASAVSSRWSRTLANFRQSPTGQWIQHLRRVMLVATSTVEVTKMRMVLKPVVKVKKEDEALQLHTEKRSRKKAQQRDLGLYPDHRARRRVQALKLRTEKYFLDAQRETVERQERMRREKKMKIEARLAKQNIQQTYILAAGVFCFFVASLLCIYILCKA